MSRPTDPILSAVGIAAALLVQAMALAAIVHPLGGIDSLALFVPLQIAAGLLEAIALRRILPARFREPRLAALALLWTLCTFVPLAGGLLVLVSAVWAVWLPASHKSERLAEVPRPEFVSYLVSRVTHGGGARLQARLINTRVASGDRLSALVAIQSMPTRTTGTLLRELLADPLEDVRLIAYGTLDKAENEIMQQIFETTQALQTAADGSEHHSLTRRMAELYFELIYQNLVQGAVYRHTLEQADRYAQAALASDESDAALWLIRGRLALANGAPDEAARYMLRAQQLGFPRERLIPWLAEAAFLHGDYPQVATLMASLGNAAALPTLKPVVRYWMS
jgi:tetratricopeptide (TPR) repeat protein